MTPGRRAFMCLVAMFVLWVLAVLLPPFRHGMVTRFIHPIVAEVGWFGAGAVIFAVVYLISYVAESGDKG